MGIYLISKFKYFLLFFLFQEKFLWEENFADRRQFSCKKN